MTSLKRKILSSLLVVSLLLSLFSVSAFATGDAVIVYNEQELIAAIDNIPAGETGEITVGSSVIILNSTLNITSKNVVLNFENAAMLEAYEKSVIYACNANITINAHENSGMRVYGSNTDISVIKAENTLGEGEFNLTVNGGKYHFYEGKVFDISSGVRAVLNEVVCFGAVESSGGEITISCGRFTNDVSAYAAQNKWCGQHGDYFYVRNKEYSDEYCQILDGGKVVFNYAKPEPESEASWLIAEDFNMVNPDFYFDPMGFNEDFTQCEIGFRIESPYEENHTVDVVWNYDSKVYEEAKKFIEKFPQDREWFNVTDLELANYWVNNDPYSESEIDTLANYSGELKGYLDNTNFLFTVEIRGGADEPFFTERIGSAKLIHNGIVYFASGYLGAKAEHAIYVPESTGSSAQELIAAAQKRIDDYIGAGKIEISLNNDTVEQYYNGEIAEYDRQLAEYQSRLEIARARYEEEMAKEEKDWDIITECQWEIMDCENQLTYIPDYKQYFIESFEEGGHLNFLNKAAGGYFFNVAVGEEIYKFVIIKDDTKLAVPSYTSVDLNTKVQVNSSSSEIPLDTMVEVEKLTDGEEYDRIIEILNASENETYDIKLRSETLNQYVTKLDNGSFEVKLPIPDNFKGKTLAVYYIDENGLPVRYSVIPDGDFAVFSTEHFSIYTLVQEGEQEGYSVLDLINLRNYLLEKTELSVNNISKLDVDGDTVLTMFDLLKIKALIFAQ